MEPTSECRCTGFFWAFSVRNHCVLVRTHRMMMLWSNRAAQSLRQINAASEQSLEILMDMYQAEDAAAIARVRLSSHTSMSSWLPPVRHLQCDHSHQMNPDLTRIGPLQSSPGTVVYERSGDRCFLVARSAQAWFKYMSSRYEQA